MKRTLVLKTKITADRRDSCQNAGSLRRFRQRSDAACAQGLANQPSIFQQRYFLEIGTKGPVGSTLGEAAVVTKGRGFATSIALSHCQDPFSAIIAFDKVIGSQKNFSPVERNGILPQSASIFKHSC
jgi:hypothetical protein